ncbi:MAG TPA: formate dehydrogenase subunit alpha [Planctomycetota bacterium]|nr:formate dehydrogenase subunit alpha [Planctomycetota bacterium]
MQKLATVNLTIDGKRVGARPGMTIWEAAREAGIDVPVLCHDPRFEPVGVCRMCAVEVEGARVMAAACVRKIEEGMVVRTASEKVERCRKMLTELLMSDQPEVSPKEGTTGGDKLWALAEKYGVDVRLPRGNSRPEDLSSPAIAVHHQACILCDRCIRACDEVQVNEVIGRTGKGYTARISFDLDNPMGKSTCVTCGECVAACPTGALVNKPVAGPLEAATKTVDSVCPYCGVGCAVAYHVDEEKNRVVRVEGRESPGNDARLCVKGRYGFDYALHPHRLGMPLIRIKYPRGPLSSEVETSHDHKRKPGGIVDYKEVMPAFREATWDEALDLVAKRLMEIRDRSGSGALAGFGSAKCTNEEAYLFQKLVRTTFGTNNVDHCTRLCHASSVAALLEMIGSGAVTTTYGDIKNAEVALLTGTNATANHPVAATFFKQAARNGTKLIVVDPRASGISRHAWRFCRIRSGTDVAFYNAMMHVIVEEGLVDEEYVRDHTTGFDAVKAKIKEYTPERAAAICGVPAGMIREVALAYGRAKAAVTYWGMGMSQHVHGTDNCRCIISLALMTGNMGKEGAGLHPLRGQNNVQGASDAGLIPMMFPDYQRVDNAKAREKFEGAWGTKLDPKPGLTVVEIMKGALEGRIKGMYMLGENPFLSDPNTNKVRKALSSLEFLVVQDIFLTETAEFADVVLPATSALEKDGTVTNTDRRVQVMHPALKPPGEARLDWRIICDISTRMGYPMQYGSAAEVFDEMVPLTDAYRGLTHRNLGATGKLYPCPEPETSDGTVVMFGDGFPTADGRAKFVPADHTGADELPDEEYPLILVTGRVLEHWHTGVMTRRSVTLDAREPEPFVEIHPDDCRKLGVDTGRMVSVSSRRGTISLKVRKAMGPQPGSVFIPFHFREAAANVLTTDKLDPFGKIPEFKFCAVRVVPDPKGATPP